MMLYRYTRQKFSLVHSRELKVNYATLGDAVGLPADSRLKCPGLSKTGQVTMQYS